MSIQIYTIIFTILNLLILYLFLRKKFFGKVTEFMDNRTNNIENQLKEAKDNLEKSEMLKSEFEKKLTDATSEGRKIVEDFKSRATNLSDEIVGKAKKDAETAIERARIESEREKEKARDEIRRQIVDLSLLAASRIINEKLDEEKHHELIEQFINEVGV